MKKIASLIVAGALSVGLSLGEARAQAKGIGTPPPPEVQANLIARVHSYLSKGEESFARGDFDHARTAFDDAVDALLLSGYDVRSDPTLLQTYRETVEKVNRYTQLGINAEGEIVWPTQEYEATAADFPTEVAPEPGDVIASAGDLVNARFLTRVSEIQRRFQEKFGRQFIVTGRDTSAHSRLYGHGRAIDVRVRDLSPAQVRFIVDTARSLRMRVLDFSSSDRVYQHNMRVISLGRSLDTMATGVHLHINDLRGSDPNYTARPAGKSKVRGKK